LSRIDISEANAKIPREVRFDDDIVSALAFTLFFFVLWLVPVGFRAHDIHTRDVLRQEGYMANGEVIKSYPGRGNVGVVYRFSVDGVSCPGRANMIADDYKVQAPGEKILIRYLPNNPSVNQPANWEWFSVWELPFYLIGPGILVALAALFIVGSRKRKLARMGVVVQGRVTGCAPDRKLFTVYYEFDTEDNVRMEGSTKLSEECEAGNSIPVMYLRSNPKRNDCYAE
jgi:hypothetical protein